MSDCVAVREQLLDSLYDLLPEWQMDDVTTHLKGCAECRASRERLVEEVKELEEWKVPGPASDTSIDFVRKISVHESGKGDWAGLTRRSSGMLMRWRLLPRGAKVVFASVSLAAVAVVAVLLSTMSGPQASVAQPESASDVAQRIYERGVGLVQSGDTGAAVDALNSALAADPNHVESRWALAWALVELGENGAAIAEFDKVVELAAGTKRAAEAEQAIERLRR